MIRVGAVFKLPGVCGGCDGLVSVTAGCGVTGASLSNRFGIVPLNSDTPAWRFQCWAAFVIAVATTTIGIWLLPADVWVRGYLGIGLWFSVSSSFTLAKAMRDSHESQKLISRVEEAKTERILREG